MYLDRYERWEKTGQGKGEKLDQQEQPPVNADSALEGVLENLQHNHTQAWS